MALKVIPKCNDDIFIFEENEGAAPVVVGRCRDIKGVVEKIGEVCNVDIKFEPHFGDYLFSSYSKQACRR